MRLSPITRSNFPLWSKFRREIYPQISTEFDLKEIENIYTSKSWYCWFIERDDGAIIGLVELSLRNIVDGCLGSPVPYLEGLYLIPTEQGKGQGAAIVEKIIGWCRKRGYSELATDTELTNIRAQKFYEKSGFEQVDKVVEYRIDIADQ